MRRLKKDVNMSLELPTKNEQVWVPFSRLCCIHITLQRNKSCLLAKELLFLFGRYFGVVKFFHSFYTPWYSHLSGHLKFYFPFQCEQWNLRGLQTVGRFVYTWLRKRFQEISIIHKRYDNVVFWKTFLQILITFLQAYKPCSFIKISILKAYTEDLHLWTVWLISSLTHFITGSFLSPDSRAARALPAVFRLQWGASNSGW